MLLFYGFTRLRFCTVLEVNEVTILVMAVRAAASVLVLCLHLAADEPQLKRREPPPQNSAGQVRISEGQRIPVKLLTTVAPGDARVYLQTVFPVSAANGIAIPAGTYIEAEITDLHRAPRVKGRAEMVVRLARLTLPNGEERHPRTDRASTSAKPACPEGAIAAPFTMRGGDAVLTPGTMADIVLRETLVLGVDTVR